MSGRHLDDPWRRHAATPVVSQTVGSGCKRVLLCWIAADQAAGERVPDGVPGLGQGAEISLSWAKSGAKHPPSHLR